MVPHLVLRHRRSKHSSKRSNNKTHSVVVIVSLAILVLVTIVIRHSSRVLLVEILYHPSIIPLFFLSSPKSSSVACG